MHETKLTAETFIELHPQDRLESAFCITIYNEELIRLQRTLSSVLASIANRARSASDETESVCLCLIVDGTDKAAPDMLAWFAEAGLLDTRLAVNLDGCEAYRSTHKISEFTGRLDGCPDLSIDVEVGFIVCLKQVNRGKLHSHAIFFTSLCGLLKPAYCIQLDVGTVIAPDAYSRLTHHMEQDASIGAIAPCITTTPPDDQSLFISTWQHIDFVVQKSMFWPFEVASGYLSVVPGQFCILRRAALMPAGDQPDVGPQFRHSSPISAYLRGLSTRNPLEKVMFLAEDRVIGGEIVLREDSSWHLEYCSETRAVTDTCLTIPELLRQRRRWSNSALACRLWLLSQILRFLCRDDRTVGGKSRFLVAMFGQAMLMVREFASPAITLSSMFAFAAIGRDLGASSNWSWPAVLNLCFGGIILACLVPKYIRTPAVSTATVAVRGVLGIVLICALTAMLVSAATSRAAMVLVLLPTALSLIAMVMVFRSRVGKIFMMLGVYVVVDIIMAPAVSAYSVWKLHDVSWGTKGLTSSVQDNILARRMKILRFFGVLFWLLINGALVVIALAFSGFTSSLLNPVFELVCALNIWVNTLVLFRLVRQAFQQARWRSEGVRFEAEAVYEAPRDPLPQPAVAAVS